MTKAYGTTVFCDDIRNELGGKISLIGCYAADLLVNEPFPIILPKLGFYVRIFLPTDNIAKSLDVRIILPGENIDSASLRSEVELGTPVDVWSNDIPTDEPDSNRFTVVILNLVLSPLHLARDGSIRVRVIAGDETVKAGRLRVRRAIGQKWGLRRPKIARSNLADNYAFGSTVGPYRTLGVDSCRPMPAEADT